MTGLGTQSLTDLAVDKTDRMIGITLDKLYGIDASSGTASLVKDLSTSARGFTSLSFVPADLADPNSADILVSANDQGDVFSVDATTGNATKIGSYGSVALGTVVVERRSDRHSRPRHLRDRRRRHRAERLPRSRRSERTR